VNEEEHHSEEERTRAKKKLKLGREKIMQKVIKRIRIN
jgi:hypothetical protein